MTGIQNLSGTLRARQRTDKNCLLRASLITRKIRPCISAMHDAGMQKAITASAPAEVSFTDSADNHYLISFDTSL